MEGMPACHGTGRGDRGVRDRRPGRSSWFRYRSAPCANSRPSLVSSSWIRLLAQVGAGRQAVAQPSSDRRGPRPDPGWQPACRFAGISIWAWSSGSGPWICRAHIARSRIISRPGLAEQHRLGHHGGLQRRGENKQLSLAEIDIHMPGVVAPLLVMPVLGIGGNGPHGADGTFVCSVPGEAQQRSSRGPAARSVPQPPPPRARAPSDGMPPSRRNNPSRGSGPTPDQVGSVGMVSDGYGAGRISTRASGLTERICRAMRSPGYLAWISPSRFPEEAVADQQPVGTAARTMSEKRR